MTDQQQTEYQKRRAARQAARSTSGAQSAADARDGTDATCASCVEYKGDRRACVGRCMTAGDKPTCGKYHRREAEIPAKPKRVPEEVAAAVLSTIKSATAERLDDAAECADCGDTRAVGGMAKVGDGLYCEECAPRAELSLLRARDPQAITESEEIINAGVFKCDRCGWIGTEGVVNATCPMCKALVIFCRDIVTDTCDGCGCAVAHYVGEPAVCSRCKAEAATADLLDDVANEDLPSRALTMTDAAKIGQALAPALQGLAETAVASLKRAKLGGVPDSSAGLEHSSVRVSVDRIGDDVFVTIRSPYMTCEAFRMEGQDAIVKLTQKKSA